VIAIITIIIIIIITFVIVNLCYLGHYDYRHSQHRHCDHWCNVHDLSLQLLLEGKASGQFFSRIAVNPDLW
jgi:hypothetical protein